MKRVPVKFFFSSPNTTFFHLLSNPTLLLHSRQTSSSLPPPTPNPHSLTPQELTQINLLLPRLCSSNDLHTAIRLLDTILLTNPPLPSLPLPLLINQLSSQPTMTESMSLLNRLNHNPSSHPYYLLHITKLLVNSYLKKRRFREVMKVVNWIWRVDSRVEMDEGMYGIVVRGFCKGGLVLEGLVVVKKMVESGVVVGEVRDWICRGLLREARVKEAKELSEGLSCGLGDGEDEDLKRVVVLLDRIITNWTD